IKGGGAHWAIAAAARVGQLYQNYADALFAAEIPKELRSDPELVDAYCGALQEVAEPLQKKAEEAYKFCLETSTSLSFYNEWSRLCETELSEIDPVTYPTSGELRAKPDRSSLIVCAQQPITTIESAPAAKEGQK
ncbi:MAG: hypothetical protein V2A73_12805, partial [Pseudomonadota bacterium]